MFLVSVCAVQKPFSGRGVRWWGKIGKNQKFIIFLLLAITPQQNVRFGSIIPFWKPQAIYFKVLSQKMAKNGQKYPPEGIQVGNPKIDPPQQILNISMFIGFFLVFSRIIPSKYMNINLSWLSAIEFNL